ncbi:MAG: hypothetical protein ACPGCP_04265 [Candidatus Nanopelagicales bacterium]
MKFSFTAMDSRVHTGAFAWKLQVMTRSMKITGKKRGESCAGTLRAVCLDYQQDN